MLTVECIEDGEVSPYLTDELRIGDRIELRGPIGGYFVWDANDEWNNDSPLFLIAGGSGIVPLMAMIAIGLIRLGQFPLNSFTHRAPTKT